MGRFLQKVFLENIALKFIAILLALLIYFFVFAERNVEQVFEVPLQIEGLPAGFIITNQVIEKVNVRIKGPRTLLIGLSPKNIIVRLDLKGILPGNSTFRISEMNIELPRGVKVVRINPIEVDLTVEKMMSKDIQVVPDFRSSPGEGYEIEEVIVTPREINISGVESEIGSINELLTETINISGVTKDCTFNVRPTISLEYSKSDFTGDILVKVKIKEKIIEEIFHRIPVSWTNTNYSVTIIPNMVDITMGGPYHKIKNLKGDQINVFIDLKGRSRGKYHEEIYRVDIPEKVYPTRFSPERLEVIIE